MSNLAKEIVESTAVPLINKPEALHLLKTYGLEVAISYCKLVCSASYQNRKPDHMYNLIKEREFV